MTLWNKQLVLEQHSACNQSHAPSYKMHGQSSCDESELSTTCNGQLLICVIFYKTCLVFILFLVPWLATYQCLNKTVLLSAASRSLTSACVRAVFCHYLTGGRDTVQRLLAALSTETTRAPIKASFAPTGVSFTAIPDYKRLGVQTPSLRSRSTAAERSSVSPEKSVWEFVDEGKRKSQMSLDRGGVSPPVSIGGYVKLGALARQQWSSRGLHVPPEQRLLRTRKWLPRPRPPQTSSPTRPLCSPASE